MSDELDRALERRLAAFAMAEPSRPGNAELLEVARARARDLADRRRRDRMRGLARLLDLSGFPLLGTFAARAAGDRVTYRLVWI